MKRRALLRVAGAALGTGTLAGCLSDDDVASTGGSGNTETTTTRNETKDTTDPTLEPETTVEETTYADDAVFDTDAQAPFFTRSIGSRENVSFPDNNRPHGVSIWNAAESERTMRISVRRGSATVFDQRLAFPADGYLTLTLEEPDDYAVVVGADSEHFGTVDVPSAHFDCNSSSTNVGVFPDGEVRSTVISTAMACSSPTVESPTIETLGSDCADEPTSDTASVSFGDDQLSIDGRIQAPNPCHEATLETISETQNGLTVVVGVEDVSDGDNCIQCVGSVEYSTTMRYDLVAPETVTVVHRSTGEERTVTTAER